jgi:hypothetical protein
MSGSLKAYTGVPSSSSLQNALPGLDPGIHVLAAVRPRPKEDVDGRDKPGQSELEPHQFLPETGPLG